MKFGTFSVPVAAQLYQKETESCLSETGLCISGEGLTWVLPNWLWHATEAVCLWYKYLNLMVLLTRECLGWVDNIIKTKQIAPVFAFENK